MSQKTILIVDDEKEMCETVSQVLTPRGYHVLMAHTGRDALALAKQHKPDLIILDLMLPDTDGWRVCQQLKKEESLKSVPVIMLSGLVDDKPEKGPLELGDAYLSKPFEMRALLEKIRDLCAQERSDGQERPSGEERLIGEA